MRREIVSGPRSLRGARGVCGTRCVCCSAGQAGRGGGMRAPCGWTGGWWLDGAPMTHDTWHRTYPLELCSTHPGPAPAGDRARAEGTCASRVREPGLVTSTPPGGARQRAGR